jgi:hypothetical protein
MITFLPIQKHESNPFLKTSKVKGRPLKIHYQEYLLVK